MQNTQRLITEIHDWLRKKGYYAPPSPHHKVGVYRVFHKRTKRSYIGQSIQINERIKQHFSNSGASRFLQGSARAMQERFAWEILEECDRESLRERENYWIEKFNSKKPNGYN